MGRSGDTGAGLSVETTAVPTAIEAATTLVPPRIEVAQLVERGAAVTTEAENTATPVVRITLPENVLFAVGSANLEGRADEVLTPVVAIARRYHDANVALTISIVGHTSVERDTPEGHRRLSLGRAVAVADRLGMLGLPADVALRTVGLGACQPTSTGEHDLAADRRVEVLIEATAVLSPQPTCPTP